jgi:uncharacterized protein YjbJ (UPF0337 family)
MINREVLQGNWNEIKGSLKEQWGALTNDDLRIFSGNVDQLVGVIQRRTGETREAIQEVLEDLTAQSASFVSTAVETARNVANRAAESAQDSFGQVADSVRDRYSDAEDFVRTKPAESMAVAFGAGLLAGLVFGLILRSPR